MKKLLSILGAMGMSAMAGATVVACAPNKVEDIKFSEEEQALLEKILLKTGLTEKGPNYDAIVDREDIKGIAKTDWTYIDFFKMEGYDEDKVSNSVLDKFYDEVRVEYAASSEDLTDETVEEFVQNVRKWTQSNVKLGYIGVEQKGFVTISKNDAKTDTLKDIFFDHIKNDNWVDDEGNKVEFDEENLNDHDWWVTTGEKLTLAIEFGFDKPMYWSFTFAN